MTHQSLPKQEPVERWESKLKTMLDDTRCGLKNSSNTNKNRYAILSLFEDVISHQKALSQAEVIDENTSDGYHTFKELYEFRKLYNAVLFNEWVSQGKYDVHKSKKHSDGELCFGGGWFIVVAQLPAGQISNHYELKDWDLFKCEERELPATWDEHTEKDVLKRLSDTLAVVDEIKSKEVK